MILDSVEKNSISICLTNNHAVVILCVLISIVYKRYVTFYLITNTYFIKMISPVILLP